jgi:hypothetical protein
VAVLVALVDHLAQKEQTALILFLVLLLQLAVEQGELLMKVLVQEVWMAATAGLAVAQEIQLTAALAALALAVKETMAEIWLQPIKGHHMQLLVVVEQEQLEAAQLQLQKAALAALVLLLILLGVRLLQLVKILEELIIMLAVAAAAITLQAAQ